jgi:hypothetical protein
MASIRTYAKTIYLCADCGQPAYPHGGDDLNMHFNEQWDGVHCGHHPLAGDLLPVDWEPSLLAEIQRCYPDTHPDISGPTPDGKPFQMFPQDVHKWAERYGVAFLYAVTGGDVTAWCRAIAENAGARLSAGEGWLGW